MLPSGPDGPSQILMVGGSDAEDDHYDNPDQTNTTLLVNMANGAISRRAAQHPRAQPREHDHPPGRHAVHERRRRRERRTATSTPGPSYTGELLVPGASSWVETAPAQEERTYHSTSLLLPDGRVATMGDDRTDNSQNRALRTVEYYNPPYLFKGARPSDHLGAGRHPLRRARGDRDARTRSPRP